MRLILSGVLGLCLAACAAPDVQPSSAVPVSETPWTFDIAANGLRAASCPQGTAFERARSMPISVDAIERGTQEQQEAATSGVSFAGAWHLTSDEPNFGGLSGLDTMRSGSLLAVTDGGAFVWIGIDPETFDPDGIGAIAYMRGADGDFLSGKKQADSEGLVFKGGLALVSFERNHRIEAFDLEGCGAAAFAARVATFPNVIEDKKIPDNKGPEALSLLPTGELRAGFEFRKSQGSPSALIMDDGGLGALEYAGQLGVYLLTGADQEGEMGVQLFRAYDPVRGNRNLIYVYDAEGQRAKIELKAPLPVDNFEGVAFGKNADGATRIWLISDDNFNAERQRTLLFAFDLD